MIVRAGDPIFRMTDLKGKRIGLSKSLNSIKNDWWRITEHMGIESMLRENGMTMKDLEIVEFPYADDWYDDPKMLEPMINPTDLWATRDHKQDLAFRPLETALLAGKVDAIYTLSKQFQHLQEATGKIKVIEDLSRYPDWTVQVANTPAVITCTEVMAKEHPELVVTYMKAMIKVGRWANQFKQAAAVLLDRQTFYRDAEDTYQGIKNVDMVPNLSPQNLACIELGKDFMVKNGYIKHDFDVRKWAAPEFLEMAAKELIEEEWKRKTQQKLPEGTSDTAWIGSSTGTSPETVDGAGQTVSCGSTCRFTQKVHEGVVMRTWMHGGPRSGRRVRVETFDESLMDLTPPGADGLSPSPTPVPGSQRP